MWEKHAEKVVSGDGGEVFRQVVRCKGDRQIILINIEKQLTKYQKRYMIKTVKGDK